MLQQTNQKIIRTKRHTNHDQKFVKLSNGLIQTKYSQPFSQLFMKKNKQRITQLQTFQNTKYSNRYLINHNKLQKLHDNQKVKDTSIPLLNQTYFHSINNPDFTSTKQISKNHSTMRSRSSNIIEINLKQLPRISTLSYNFNGSINKIQTLKFYLNQFGKEAINLTKQTTDFKITLDQSKLRLEEQNKQVQKNLQNKILQLQKLIKETQQRHKNRSQVIKKDCKIIKQKNQQIKEYLCLVQRKLSIIQNTMGLITSHHKHFV